MTAADIEHDLLKQFERCAPHDRVRIKLTAELAARLSELDDRMRADGCDEEDAAQHRDWLTLLTRALYRMSPSRICQTQAASILARGYQTAAATFAVLPPAGSA